MEKYTLEQLQNKILYFINYRLRSRQEVVEKLKKIAATDEQISLLLDQLAAYGLVDDEKFISLFIHENLYVKKLSISHTKQALKQKGFKEPLITEALSEFLECNDFSELEQAFYALKQKFSLDRVLESKKMLSFLARKGFSYSLASEAVALYLKDLP